MMSWEIDLRRLKQETKATEVWLDTELNGMNRITLKWGTSREFSYEFPPYKEPDLETVVALVNKETAHCKICNSKTDQLVCAPCAQERTVFLCQRVLALTGAIQAGADNRKRLLVYITRDAHEIASLSIFLPKVFD
jgi:hypothetical protein